MNHTDMFAEQEAIVKTYRPIEALVPAHWREGDVHANGVRQHYYRTGNGEKPPLLLLHGFHQYGLSWLSVARKLEQDYDVIMLDARGHGHSEGIASGFSDTLLVEDVRGAIQTLGLEQPRVIGMSQGGSTVLRLAAWYQELVHSFVFEGWGTGGQRGEALVNNEGYQNWYKGWLAWLDGLKTASHEERMISTLAQLLPASGGKLPPEDEYVPAVEGYALFDSELARYGIKLWELKQDETPDELLRRVRCPALIMQHGDFFAASGAQPGIREVESGLPNIRIVFFENTGHLIRYAAFEQYLALVREFLSE